MELMGQWAPAVQRDSSAGKKGLGDKLGFFAFPAVDGGKGSCTDAFGGGGGFAVGKNAPPEAVEFLKFIAQPDNARIEAKTAGVLPVVKAAAQDAVTRSEPQTRGRHAGQVDRLPALPRPGVRARGRPAGQRQRRRADRRQGSRRSRSLKAITTAAKTGLTRRVLTERAAGRRPRSQPPPRPRRPGRHRAGDDGTPGRTIVAVPDPGAGAVRPAGAHPHRGGRATPASSSGTASALPTNFVGLDNFTGGCRRPDLRRRPAARRCCWSCCRWCVQLPVSLALAMLLNQPLRGRRRLPDDVLRPVRALRGRHRGAVHHGLLARTRVWRTTSPS